MTKQKSTLWGGQLNNPPEQKNVLFCAGRDVQTLPMADEVLIPYDIWTNRAHCIMLARQNLIGKGHLKKILRGLTRLESESDSGDFVLDPAKEDVHTNVEAFVTKHEGVDAGGRMHIGRSRNDQSACDMRLYLRDQGLRIFDEVHALAKTFLEQAGEHSESVMPGFTHYQPAMVTTWGHWLCSYAQGLGRDLERLEFALNLVDRNPLGAAAAFGASWPLDRKLTAELLGFARVELNTLDCIVSRWENEAQLAHACCMLMNRLSIISQDLIILGMPSLALVRIDDAYVTGSSIMPQKKNPDFAEVIKSKTSVAHGQLLSLLGVQKGGLSGYNRDTQATKYLIMDLIRDCAPAAEILKGVFQTLHVNVGRMREQCESGFMNAVDLADLLTRELDLPFRESHRVLAHAVKLCGTSPQISASALRDALREYGHDPDRLPENMESYRDPAWLITQRNHLGSPAPAMVLHQKEVLAETLKEQEKVIGKTRTRIASARERCRAFHPDTSL